MDGSKITLDFQGDHTVFTIHDNEALPRLAGSFRGVFKRAES